MKLFTVAVVTLLALTAVGVYHSVAEESAYHMRIKKIADQINSEDLSWKAEMPQRFFGKTKAEVKRLMGTFIEEEIPLPDVLEYNNLNLEQLPKSFESKQKWPKCQSIKDIRDQANCGSCWAFGAVESMSDRLCIEGHNRGLEQQKLQIRISSENLFTCCHSCGQGCHGGWPSQAWQYFANTGLVTGWNYGGKHFCQPYKIHPCTPQYPRCQGMAPTPQCSHSCQPGYSKSYNNDKHFGANSYSVLGESKMMAELVKNGPFELTFSVYEDFISYKSGVYWHRSGGRLGGHAVKLVGYGTLNGIPYWRIANSWNRGWGMDGFFLMRRGHNDCGIESGGVAGMMKM